MTEFFSSRKRVILYETVNVNSELQQIFLLFIQDVLHPILSVSSLFTCLTLILHLEHWQAVLTGDIEW
uniref:Uncharacterized protein n=1 Tax=Pinctada fucata TaxID=50426 RepID=A0A194ANN0_PINFU